MLAMPPPGDPEAPTHVVVPMFGPRMVCTRCGIIGADARPNWQGRDESRSAR
jgi:hypothetical protein